MLPLLLPLLLLPLLLLPLEEDPDAPPLELLLELPLELLPELLLVLPLDDELELDDELPDEEPLLEDEPELEEPLDELDEPLGLEPLPPQAAIVRVSANTTPILSRLSLKSFGNTRIPYHSIRNEMSP